MYRSLLLAQDLFIFFHVDTHCFVIVKLASYIAAVMFLVFIIFIYVILM